MQELAGKAFAVGTASQEAISAVTARSAGFATHMLTTASTSLADMASRVAGGLRALHARAGQPSRQSLALIAASAVLLVSLLLLALPSGNGGQGLTTVELALGDSGSSVRLAVEPPAPRVPRLGDPEPVGAVASAAPETAPKQAKEPNLAGLAEIPKDLLASQPEHKEDNTQRKPSFAAPTEARENLPWDAVEPVTFTPMGPGQQHAPGQPAPAAASAAPVAVSDAEIGKWLKGKATKIKGADRTKPLYHFVIWLEPPAALQAHLAGVSYDFSSPAVQPQSQASSDPASQFRINAAGLACADEITVTIRFDDGRVEKTNIDGCALFDKA